MKYYNSKILMKTLNYSLSHSDEFHECFTPYYPQLYNKVVEHVLTIRMKRGYQILAVSCDCMLLVLAI